MVMSKSVLDAPHFHDEHAAYEYLEARIWPQGPMCPHCGGYERIGKLKGKSTRVGVWKCYQCRKPFRATVGTVFESSHVPLRLWLQAIHLMSSSKKGISSNQLHRTLGVTLKTAWFMSHRVREAMRVLGMPPMGGEGQVVEADETFIGRLEGQPKGKSGYGHKNVVLTLVERGGSARSFHVDAASVAQIVPLVRKNIARETNLMTDEARHYVGVGKEFNSHGAVHHAAEEYVRGDIHTNTVEGYYSIFKRGMKGVYQHCAEKHLHRYLAEFDFRYSNRLRLGIDDVARADRALKGIVGKRLTYKATGH
ncbi:MAG: ISSpo8, transposase [Bradyrhizobium sp.]|nr:ISSpo8, transposase [Bradyrhizobium sp.]